TTDTDPTHSAQHQIYGDTTRDQVDKLVKLFDGYSAVWGYYIADEPAGHLQDVLPVLQNRYQQVKNLTSKPTLASVWRQPDDSLRLIKHGTDHLMMDYYPYPEGGEQKYGTVGDIPKIARDVSSVAGNSSWFSIQAFSYYRSEPDK